MHTVFALLCFVVVIHWLIFPYPSGLLHWHCGNLTMAPVPAKQPWWLRINTSCEFIMNDCETTTKQSTTKPCAYFLGYTVALMDCSTNGGKQQETLRVVWHGEILLNGLTLITTWISYNIHFKREITLLIHSRIYWVCANLSMLWLKLSPYRKMEPLNKAYPEYLSSW